MWIHLLACTGSVQTEPALPTGDTDATVEPACPTVGPGVATGEVAVPTLVEASGLVVTGDILWSHNDSGTPELFALDHTGQRVATLPVQTDARDDWEGATRRDGQLWIGDIGDNLAMRSGITLLAVDLPEPVVDGVTVVPRPVRLSWPDGPVDSEALLGDPVTGDLLLVTKVFDGDVGVYRVVDPDADVSTLEEVARLAFGEGPLSPTTLVTGGDIAPDGSGVILRTYLDAFIWPRVPGEPWSTTFAREPCRVELETEPQGETIAWGFDNLWSISEGSAQTVWSYPVTAAP